MAPLEPWEKVLVFEDKLGETAHGKLSCTYCHGGSQTPEKETAHADMVSDPSAAPAAICDTCHAMESEGFSSSLHASLQGYWTALETRSAPENHTALETMFGNHCARCHTTCSDCHISQPDSVGGGLLNGHVVEKTPPMSRTCTACHGSRIGNEFLGKNEEIPGDAHFRLARMNCVSCHAGTEMHNSTSPCLVCHKTPEDTALANVDHRYSGAQTPACESCHPEVNAAGNANLQHTIHSRKLSCQVCHSITYTNCDGCHVSLNSQTGNPFFETAGTYFTFLIGRNPSPDYHRPYEYVPVRHIPVAETSFEFYGESLLPNFAALTTWAFATPHNIQRQTPQNASCNSCHGNAALFLTVDKVLPVELQANLPVIINQIPPAVPVGNP